MPLVLKVPRIMRLLVLRLIEIRAGSWEPENTIGHLRMKGRSVGRANREGERVGMRVEKGRCLGEEEIRSP